MKLDERDGNWLDKFGACKVCDGEMPTGHTNNCDVYMLEVALRDANDLCRSAMEIAKRDGKDTNWETFRARLEASLLRQHARMYSSND